MATSIVSTETSATFSISFEQLIELISATLEVSYRDIPTIIYTHTTNFGSLIIMLEQVRKHVEVSSSKISHIKTVRALSRAIVTESASGSDATIFLLLFHVYTMREHNCHVVAHSNSNFSGDCILFWNLRSAVNKKTELQKLTEKYYVIG